MYPEHRFWVHILKTWVMKPKTIRKLRKKIASFDEYVISESYSLFGEFLKLEDAIKWHRRIRANSPEMAMRRYVKRKERWIKEESELRGHWGWSYETTANWAKVRVFNLRTGWKTYYR